MHPGPFRSRFQPRALPGVHGQTLFGLVLPMKILIVDDSLDNRLLLQTLLKSAGYGDVLMAASAREALSRLAGEERTPVSFRTLIDNAAHAGPADVDLVLMDFMMQRMEWSEACRRI